MTRPARQQSTKLSREGSIIKHKEAKQRRSIISTPVKAIGTPAQAPHVHMYSTCSHTNMKLIIQAKNLEHSSQ